jgi:hypothetical protein
MVWPTSLAAMALHQVAEPVLRVVPPELSYLGKIKMVFQAADK